jgi:glycosyltransferase involved in cell wall biosynthesis
MGFENTEDVCVSVIMPVYNGQETVRNAVDAVLGQTFSRFELILIDDGSTDDTFAICSDLAERDARVRFMARPHSGVSSSRNAGLAVARGIYVAFADADDDIGPGWLASLRRGVDCGDLAVCGYEVLDVGGRLVRDTKGTSMGQRLDVAASQFMEDLFSNRLMYQGYVWNKMFKRALLNEGDRVRFGSGLTRNEDRLFVFEYLMHCESVSYCDAVEYHYHEHPLDGAYHTSWSTELSSFDRVAEIVGDDPGMESVLHYLEKDCFRAAVTLLDKARKAGHPDALWLEGYVSSLSRHADEFSEYPEEFQTLVRETMRSLGQ